MQARRRQEPLLEARALAAVVVFTVAKPDKAIQSSESSRIVRIDPSTGAGWHDRHARSHPSVMHREEAGDRSRRRHHPSGAPDRGGQGADLTTPPGTSANVPFVRRPGARVSESSSASLAMTRTYQRLQVAYLWCRPPLSGLAPS